MNRDRAQSDGDRAVKAIDEYLAQFSKFCPRPDLRDKTIRGMIAGELAGKLRKVYDVRQG